MSIFKPSTWFKGEVKSTGPAETKSAGPTSSMFGTGFIDFLQSNNNFDLSFFMMIRYYEQVGPLADAIDKVAQEFSTIRPRVWDKKANKFIEHPIDDLLNYPHAEMSREEFLFGLCAFYLLTGNAFPYITLDSRGQPLELNMYLPQHTVMNASSEDGFLGRIQVNNIIDNDVFTRIEDFRRFRYVDKDENSELWPIRRFNPRRSSNNLYGTSPIASIFYEIEQYIASSKHNLSLLKRGARPGGVFSTVTDMPLSDEQFERMQKQIDQYYVGENNAGRPLLMENTKYEESIVNNKDMDYSTMRKNIQAMIYNRLNIPLPSISGENMTLANMDVAKLNLYDNAVIPVTQTLFGQLGRFLFPRFDDRKRAEQLELRFDQGEIPALQLRRNEVVKLRKEVGVNTDNELRAHLGDEPITGGDVVYKPTNMVPVGIDEDDVANVPDERNDNSSDVKSMRAKYVSLMQEQKDNEGKRLYTDEEIETKANAQFKAN